jgi:hypothetical protein
LLVITLPSCPLSVSEGSHLFLPHQINQGNLVIETALPLWISTSAPGLSYAALHSFLFAWFEMAFFICNSTYNIGSFSFASLK